MTLQELKQKECIICLPQKIRLDTGLIGRLSCNLHCNSNTPTLNLLPAGIFLSKGRLAVDDNGDLISLLDTDIDRKLVVIEDINLYFAIRQSKLSDSEVLVNIQTEMPGNKKWNF